LILGIGNAFFENERVSKSNSRGVERKLHVTKERNKSSSFTTLSKVF
jgi:hypothetical protein